MISIFTEANADVADGQRGHRAAPTPGVPHDFAFALVPGFAAGTHLSAVRSAVRCAVSGAAGADAGLLQPWVRRQFGGIA